MRATVVIPARIGSTRLERKLLKPLLGETVLRRTIMACLAVDDIDIVVVTDSDEIMSSVVDLGCRMILTGNHKSGTERIASILDQIETDIIINVQGDEPLLDPNDLSKLISVTGFNKGVTSMYRKLEEDELLDSNTVKVFVKYSEACMFTRSPLFVKMDDCYKHIGIYGFHRKDLYTISKMTATDSSKANSLEQLSWMENGIPVHMMYTEKRYISIDTESDLVKAEIVLKHYENLH